MATQNLWLSPAIQIYPTSSTLSSSQTSISTLPPEILHQILSYLDLIKEPDNLLSNILATKRGRHLFDTAWQAGAGSDLSIFGALRVCKLWKKVLLENVLRVEKIEDWEKKIGLFEEVVVYVKIRSEVPELRNKKKKKDLKRSILCSCRTRSLCTCADYAWT